jgi:hypothetical protein
MTNDRTGHDPLTMTMVALCHPSVARTCFRPTGSETKPLPLLPACAAFSATTRVRVPGRPWRLPALGARGVQVLSVGNGVLVSGRPTTPLKADDRSPRTLQSRPTRSGFRSVAKGKREAPRRTPPRSAPTGGAHSVPGAGTSPGQRPGTEVPPRKKPSRVGTSQECAWP